MVVAALGSFATYANLTTLQMGKRFIYSYLPVLRAGVGSANWDKQKRLLVVDLNQGNFHEEEAMV
jgi:hypothetical protein